MGIAAWSKVTTPNPSPIRQTTLETTSHDIIFGMVVVFAAGVLIVLCLAAAASKGEKADASAKELSEQIRALGGLLAVVGADAAVILASVWAVGRFRSDTNSNVAILSAGFSAVTAITTAYLSIKAVSNTARTAMHAATVRALGGPPEDPPDVGTSDHIP